MTNSHRDGNWFNPFGKIKTFLSVKLKPEQLTVPKEFVGTPVSKS